MNEQQIPQVAIAGNQPKLSVDEANKIIKALNPDQVIKDNIPKLEEAVLESIVNERASKEPLPVPTEEAFSNEPLIVDTSFGKVTIRPMVAYDLNIFKKTNSPFYRIIMGDQKQSELPAQLFTEEEEAYELVYQFTHPPKDAYNLFKKGRENYKDKVMEEVAFTYNLEDTSLLVTAIMKHIFHVNLARVNFTKDNSADTIDTGDKKKLMSLTDTNTTGSQVVPVV